jgi:hypothetical protein
LGSTRAQILESAIEIPTLAAADYLHELRPASHMVAIWTVSFRYFTPGFSRHEEDRLLAMSSGTVFPEANV